VQADPLPIPEPYRLRRVAPGDGRGLARFCRELSRESRRRLTPIGLRIDRNTCELICFDNWLQPSDKYDLVLTLEDRIVAWGFLWGLQGPSPSLGLVVGDEHQRHGLGRAVLAHLMRQAAEFRVRELHLTVDADHAVARRLYESAGFAATGEQPAPRGRRYVEMSVSL
jgi:GNAT superfamily N-acetyltransferase